MPFDWREYHAVAQYLQTQSHRTFSQEAAHRCAVSRAYYAAFCHTRNYAKDHYGFLPSNQHDEHRLVREYFQRRGDIAIARDLDLLRQWRNQCDYIDNISNLSLMVIGAIAGAQRIFDALR